MRLAPTPLRLAFAIRLARYAAEEQAEAAPPRAREPSAKLTVRRYCAGCSVGAGAASVALASRAASPAS